MLDDERHMSHCIEVARKAEGRTSPNPMVGALVVDDNGQVIAEGFHAKAGEPHAEVHALDKAGPAAKGKTLYVNLEPCCHHGRTPPCSQKVITSGVKRVVIGMKDPNPKVAGGGIDELKAAGIEVTVGILEDRCRYLNRAFLKWISKKSPWLCLKMAATLDGRIADRTGKSRWISGPEARAYVHELRDRFDCVLIGGATALRDDPQLTVRDINIKGSRNPLRAVLDSKLELKGDSRLLLDHGDGSRTVLFADTDIAAANGSTFSGGIEVVGVARNANGLDLVQILKWLAENRITSVMCEGGARLAGSLLRDGLVDEVEWIVAPKFLCDEKSKSAVSDSRYIDLSNAIALQSTDISKLGEDVLIRGLVNQP